MAQKEGLVIILDVSKRSKESSKNKEKTFFENQKECCIKLLQQKIFADKKDEIAFLLMGTENTDNELNRNLDGYENIVEGISMQIPNWNILTSLVNSINLENGSDTVDWMDGLVIALDILRREEAKRFKNVKIVLFHHFLYSVDDSSTEEVVQRLKDINAELVIINDNIKYKDNFETKLPNPFFGNTINKSTNQIISEKLANRLIEETGGILCNFDIALPRIIQGIKPKGRPWFWYSTLDIGSKVKIYIGVTIGIKPEPSLKFKTESAKSNSICWLATEYFENGEKIMSSNSLRNEIAEETVNQKDKYSFEDFINGYMLGSTPIPYEKSLPPTRQCMQIISFTQRSNVLPQYFIGTGTYLVFARPTMEASEKMMSALVKALVKKDFVMIGRRVYRDGFRPKFVALFPNTEQKYPCLTLFELHCAEQQVNWYFPTLKSKKSEPTEEQYNAIEDLINSMNLDCDLNCETEREQYEKDLLPLNSLPNVTNEYVCQVATERIIEEANDITLSIKGRDNFFNVPDQLYKRSQGPLEKIKELFKLEEIKKEVKKELIRHVGNIDSREADNEIIIENKPLDYKALISIGTVTPAEDYKQLIKQEVESLSPDRQEDKTILFDKLAKQIQEVLKDLIFKTITLQYEKIVTAIRVYRDEAALYNAFDYNDFIREIKYMISCRKMYEFWEEVIVKNHLGLLSSKESNMFNEMNDVNDVQQFYQINIEKPIDIGHLNVENVDDLFDDM